MFTGISQLSGHFKSVGENWARFSHVFTAWNRESKRQVPQVKKLKMSR